MSPPNLLGKSIFLLRNEVYSRYLNFNVDFGEHFGVNFASNDFSTEGAR